MCKRFLIAAAAVVLTLSASTLFAQCACGTAAYAPAVAYSAYYAPAVTYYSPAPYVSYYAPVTTYYTPYSTYYTPYTTYYTPYTAYAPVAPAPYVTYGASMYGTPKVYVRGEPVRNVLRAFTP